jgi:hypothetical protein
VADSRVDAFLKTKIGEAVLIVGLLLLAAAVVVAVLWLNQELNAKPYDNCVNRTHDQATCGP